ncbi:RNA polymerase sigma factor RpoH [Tepidimonas alkaliphilus]|uniref:RNA polymerase sigma factor RpoH n=1 Tax=Tepidimonas alkaliphilus TaxID=2588942 RepID=A0A554WCN6_9BURK|nr:RNA polymerase sigma factor RpoH [Tepidimonas alkaliphilus]TSE21350.1 RNA polymerase sigma factor RpoH [Tepidimonas alkaliphilus]
MSATSFALAPSAAATLPAASWSSTSLTLPPLGNLDAYISAVNRIPMLSAEEERECARRLRERGDLEAAAKLVLSHLRLVVAISRQYLGYGLPQADLIQEGNIGLMKAVRRFDPALGVRLVSYAVHWIKAEIHEFILRNWRMVKVATTKAQRKLFFNLRSLKNGLKADAAETRERLSPAEIDAIARDLNVRREDVVEMEARLSGADVALDPLPADEGEDALAPIAYLADHRHEPTEVLAARERERLATDGIEQALAQLDERSRRIIRARWLDVDENGQGGKTLQELADEYGVSAERIRQIEAAALKKLRKALEPYAA